MNFRFERVDIGELDVLDIMRAVNALIAVHHKKGGTLSEIEIWHNDDKDHRAKLKFRYEDAAA